MSDDVRELLGQLLFIHNNTKFILRMNIVLQDPYAKIDVKTRFKIVLNFVPSIDPPQFSQFLRVT